MIPLYYISILSRPCVCILAESLRLSLRNLRDNFDTYEIEEAALSSLT